MKEHTRQRTEWIIEYIFVIVVIGILLYRLLGLDALQIAKYPINYNYGGDGVTGMATVKSMLEHGWIYENPSIGAPYGGQNYDATTMELFLSAMEQVLVWVTGNWVLSYNVFYLSGYFLAGLTAFYALKKLNINGIIAAPTSVLYAFAPYHFARNTNHMYLGMYFMVPIMVLFLFRLMNGEMIFQKGEKGWITRRNVIRFLALMIMALTGIYYAFFTCFFLCVIILYQLLNGEGWKKTRQAFFSIGVMVTTLGVAAIPNIIYWTNHGRAETLSKGGEGAELYGLKIIQLLLPIPNHRREILMRLRNLYDSHYPLITENGSASLGLFMAVGFVILCLVLFIGRKKISDQSNLRIGSILNLSAVLFGTIGGFAVILSFVTGSIRCYNRFSIFIAMFSLIAIDSVIQMIQDKWFHKKWKTIVFAVGMILIMFCGIYDQTVPFDRNVYAVCAERFDQDEAFVQAIEAEEDENAMIFQMPYMRYPENGNVNQMRDYAHLTGYLHSDTLRWSYGSPVGREGDQWLQSVNELPIRQQIETIQEAGFAGIYIDWNAYLPDERTSLEEILASEVDEEPIINAGNTKAYYSFH